MCGSLAGALTMPNVTPFILDHVRPTERADALAMRNVGQVGCSFFCLLLFVCSSDSLFSPFCLRAQDGGALLGAASMGLVAQFAGVPLAMHATAALQAGAATLFLLLSRETAKAHAAAKAAKAAKDA